MKGKTANLAIVSNNTLPTKKSNKLQHQHNIINALQTTLEFKQLITLFSEKVEEIIPHSGCIYTNEEFNLEIELGNKTHHSCSYTLTIDEKQLGNLKLMRRNRFTHEELQLLETLLCYLVYPLNNASLLKQAIDQAHIDPLTQAKNRAAFDSTVSREISLAQRNDNSLSAIFLDIDHFKSINDDFGHACGDMVLSVTAKLIKQCARDSDLVFRYGGEEFVLLLSNTDLSGAQLLAERIRKKLEHHTLAFDMEPVKITASLGIATLKSTDSLESFIQRADSAMYQAKDRGRNQVMLEN
jgi:diguanylate cyclase (GGDEF)-like protein